MTRVALVLNPAAPRSRAAQEAVESACAELHLPGPVLLRTTVAEPGADQAREALAGGADRVVVAGGDGTVRLVAGVLGEGVSEGVRGRGPAVLGVVPSGTANLFARGLGLPLRDLRAAARVAVGGHGHPVDLGRAELTDDAGVTTQHPFLVVVGLGHDAETLAALDRRLKERVRWLAYFEPGLRRLARPGRPVVLSLDGEVERTEQLWSVLAVSSGRLPLRARLVPGARPDDGQLHVVLVAPSGPADWVRVARTGFGGRHTPHPALRYRRGRVLAVRPAEPALVQVDGDVVADIVSARVALLPGAVLVAVPPPARSPAS
ncbi:diacylglycerol/lipid kinase family protein [Ornithinimicrobium sufpigmenti]|uniref:diacylglycerol/lipid kinase family protein n=1 Tax=Ornithinimicrobium sufpigmenti TaxID=2508882 RepID=UPI001035E692|nr:MULTISPECIES: diacylglycerol kinase family protein [unclassified Ornithinimicrobium]